jgi:Ca2+:H+ antiporter
MPSTKSRSGVDPNLLVPPVSFVVLAVAWVAHPTGIGLPVLAVFLGASVLSAVHHAEVVAHRLGEPFGSLVLAVAVTVIEVALIVTLMVSGGKDTSRWRGTRCSPR